MEEIRIQLIFNVEDFTEIYYQNGNGNLLTNKPFRNAVLLPFFLIAITILVYFLSMKFPGISWILTICCLAIFGALVYATISVVKFLKWKRTINSFYKKLSLYTSYNLFVSANSIEVTLDTETTIERWDRITSMDFNDDYIGLRIEEKVAFLFPAKSMLPDEFIRLKEFIREKLK